MNARAHWDRDGFLFQDLFYRPSEFKRVSILFLPTLRHGGCCCFQLFYIQKKKTEWVHDKDEMEFHCDLYVCKSAFFFCLQQAAKEVSQALNNCVNFLPGQRDVDEAIKAVVDSSQSLAVEDVRALLASQVTS